MSKRWGDNWLLNLILHDDIIFILFVAIHFNGRAMVVRVAINILISCDFLF